MEIITSSDNKIVKRIIKLKQKKYRDEFGEYFVEGVKNVSDSIAAQPDAVKTIVLGETAYRTIGERFANYRVTVLSDELMRKLTETEVGQGVLSINRMGGSVFPSADRCILLDRVRDPGNVGTILRTAVACDYDVVVNNCVDVYSPKVVRSAMSAICKCNIGFDIDVFSLKNAGYELVVADMSGANVFGAPHGEKYCIVVGNEGDGVSADIINAADRLLSVPQHNIESLNVAVAAAVMMFAMRYGK